MAGCAAMRLPSAAEGGSGSGTPTSCKRSRCFTHETVNPRRRGQDGRENLKSRDQAGPAQSPLDAYSSTSTASKGFLSAAKF